MVLVTLAEAKEYLRVDSDDESTLIQSLLLTSEKLAVEVSRLSATEWSLIDSEATTDPDGKLTDAEIIEYRAVMKTAVLFSLGYLYEHREEADHHGLVITLRNLLFAIREGRPGS